MILYKQKANESDTIERKIENIIAKGKTKFADYLFFNSKVHGVCIALDGDIQSCESDEKMYHEALVHPAMLLHPNPKTVLIMGGGEGATAREVLAHKNVQRVVMVDIDEEFVSLCKKHIPSWSKNAFNDSRLKVFYMDINEYLKSCNEKFDVVIGDLVDVEDWDSPVASLYAEEFYRNLKLHLNKNAIVATQGGALDIQKDTNHKKIREMMSHVFNDIASYGVVIPSFYHLWGYVIASDDLSTLNKDFDNHFRSVAKGLKLYGLGIESLIMAFNLPNQINKSIGI